MKSVEKAFQNIDRADFLPHWERSLAYIDSPISIGYGQTNSQPYTVNLMLEWLDARIGEKVLDVGSGSGWTTALLAQIVGAEGKVYAVELVPELVDFGRENCKRIGIKNVQFFQAGDAYGLPEHAPFDRILVSAAANTFPRELLRQLRVGGKLVVPVRNDILEITKTSDKDYKSVAHPGFMFVPLL